MDEEEASCMRGEKLSTAMQSIKENLTCRICLELFLEPVTIKCGHKFCRACILRVTSNENPSCPFCNIKIQKRSIPKEGNDLLQQVVEHFKNLVKAIQTDSGIDALCYNKVKNTKEGLPDYCKPSTFKVEDTPSTSKGSSPIVNLQSVKPKATNPVKSRLSLSKKKADNRSPSQNPEKNTLHKYLSNKSDPVLDQIFPSQEKVQSWLESCTSDDNDSIRNMIPASSKKLNNNLIAEPASTLPKEIYDSPQNNKTKESDASLVPTCDTSSGSRYKETQMRIQELETMAKKKKVSLGLKEKSNIKTPSSVPATSHIDADDWRRMKRVGREMQVKTFKSLSVSIEKYTPPVVDDTVIYNSTNNDSMNISHDSGTRNSSTDKAPHQAKKCCSLKSENNNLLKKSPQIIVEDKCCSMDSTSSPQEDFVASFKMDKNQLNEIIGVMPTTSVSKTPEKVKTSSRPMGRSTFKSKLNQSSPSEIKSNSGQELSEDESLNCDSKPNVINLQNSPFKEKTLSLKKAKDLTTSKNSSASDTPDKPKEKDKDTLICFSSEKLKNKLLQESTYDKINGVECTLKATMSTGSSNSNNLANKRLSSPLSNRCRFVFKKLGKICKKRNNVPFVYHGNLEKIKSPVVLKSIEPVCIDIIYKQMKDKNIANLEECYSDESHSKSNLQSKLPIKCAPVDEYEEAMDIDKDIDGLNQPGPSNQQMEIDNTLPPVKGIVKYSSGLPKINSDIEVDVEEIEDAPVNENVPESFKHFDEGHPSTNSKIINECFDPIVESSSIVDLANLDLSSYVQTKLPITKKCPGKTDVDGILEDLSSDDSAAQIRETDSMHKVSKSNYSKSSRKSRQKKKVKSDVENCAESDISVTSEKKVVAKPRFSSTSSSELKTTKKKRTHSESSNDDDDVVSIIDKWVKSDKDQVSKKPKIQLDSEEMINRNASKMRNRSKPSSLSSSDEQEDTVVEKKQLQNSLNNEMVPMVKSQSAKVNVNKLTAKPSLMLSADLFESNEQSVQPSGHSVRKQFHKSAKIDSNTQCDRENMSERSRENITMVDTRQLKRRKSVTSNTADSDDKENNEYNRAARNKMSIKATEDYADEIESSQRRTSIVSKSAANNGRKRAADCNTSITATEQPADEIECSQKDKEKTVDFEHESNPYFVRDSLLNITQEQIACKNIEKDLFGVDLSKINDNQNEDPLTIDKLSTPRRKPKQSEEKQSQENDDFDSDNIAPTPVAKRRHILRLPSSQSSPKSDINASEWSSPGRETSLIPAITPMKNRKSYPLCHSTPMISSESPENQNHTQPETVKIICTSLTAENMKVVQTFVNRFHVQIQNNFEVDVTHVIVNVDSKSKTAPKTFKYIQGIAFKKQVVSFEWIVDCLAKGKLLDADDEKYDVLDPDILESGSKKSRISSQKLFENYLFYCLEPFEKVSSVEFKELLTYNGAEIVGSVNEFHLHKNKIKVIIAGSDDVNDDCKAVLVKTEAVAVFFEWVVDSLSQYQVLPFPSYFCETTIDKARRLKLPPELLIEEETLEGEEYDDDN